MVGRDHAHGTSSPILEKKEPVQLPITDWIVGDRERRVAPYATALTIAASMITMHSFAKALPAQEI